MFSEKGPTEPIPIEIKTDREGLGRSQARKEVYEMKLKEIRSNTVSPNEYRSRITEKVILKQIEGDLRKSQRMCERFDSDNVRKVNYQFIDTYFPFEFLNIFPTTFRIYYNLLKNGTGSALIQKMKIKIHRNLSRL